MQRGQAGIPLSPTVFNIYLDDIESKWVQKGEGGSVIRGEKIYCLKFADDVVAIADSKEGIQSMVGDLEKFCEKNKMEVNAKKTKIMIFRNGGKLKKGEKVKFNNEELEIVKEYKYLGIWLAQANSYNNHIKKTARKFQGTMNSVWGIWKRAKINNLNKRMFLTDSIVKSSCLYGSEIWGWGRKEEIEKIQGNYVKRALGLDRNTPSYIWRVEAGRNSLEIETRKRAGRYLIKILEMGRNKWPAKCL